MQMLAPVFLVGCPRSGTTLLQQMLDAHPAIAIAPETHFIRNFWLKRSLYGNLDIDSSYHNLLQDIISIPEFSEMELSDVAFISAAQTIKRDYKNLFWLLLEQFRQKRGVKIVGEKTPNHLLYMQTLRDFFPNACFIHIIRDPRAVVNSWKKVPWTTGSISGDAKVWKRYMATAQQATFDNKTLFSLHYESLVSEPEVCLKSICKFLGLQFDTAMLNYYIKDLKGVNINREPWKNNAIKPVNIDSLLRWKQEMTPDEIAVIELITKDEMARLKYEFYAPQWRILRMIISLKIQSVLAQLKQYTNNWKKQ
jgi:hypothetical protein